MSGGRPRRVLAIGDGHVRTADRRHPIRERALAQILAHAEDLGETGLDLIVWPGDLFHAESEIPDRNWLRRYVLDLAEIAPVLIVKGNHDKPGELDVFDDLRARHRVEVVTSPRVATFGDGAGGRVAVACLPYPEKAGLVSAGLPSSEIGPAVDRAFDAVFLELGAQLATLEADGVPTLFAGHVTIGGAELSVGQPLIGQDLQITAGHLAKLPPSTLVVLNHIHKPQQLHGATYIGSIAPVDYGEAERKRFLQLEAHPGAPWALTSIPLDVPPMYHVEGLAGPDGFTWQVTKGPDGPTIDPPASWRGCDVRVRYRFRSADAGRLEFARAEIFATFAEAYHLEPEPVAIVDREVRAPAVAAAVTLADKVRAWAELAGLPTTDAILDKLAALESDDASALLEALERRLAEPVTVSNGSPL